MASSTPGTSYLVSPCALLSLTSGNAAAATMMAKGTLTPRHQRQEAYSVSTPPTINPIAAPPPESAPNTPNALARSFGSVKVTVTMDSDAGAIRAANAPWSARAANSSSWLGARPPIADAPANPRRPMMKVRFRPV